MKMAFVRKAAVASILVCGSGNTWAVDTDFFSDEVAFVSIRNGNAHVFTVSSPGTDKPLTSGNSVNTEPSWSPDGKRIAFTSNREGLTKIFVMERDGSNVHRVTKDDRIESAPSWSPDGKSLAFYSRDISGGNTELRISNNENGSVVSVPGNGLDKGPEAPVWSADGEYLAFVGIGENRIAEIWVVGHDGQNARAISTQASNRNKAHPDFSPIENKIAYVADMKGTLAIMATDLDTGLTENLTQGIVAAHEHPKWSRDGEYLLFSSARDDEMRTRTDIFVMKADGSNVRNLSKNPYEDFDPHWTTDGKHVVFTSLRTGSSQMFVLDIDSGKTLRLTENASHDLGPVVRPNDD